MNPKLMLSIALILGAIAVYLLTLQLDDKEWVFEVAQDHAAGTKLKGQGAYKPVAIPRANFEAMKSQLPTRRLEDWIKSTPLARDVRAGEKVTYDLFLDSADPGVKAEIGEGMRAISIQVGGVEAVGYLLRPGDRVDVLGTLPRSPGPDAWDGAAAGAGVSSKVLLQARKVLAVGQRYRLEDSAYAGARSFSTVTLEVEPQEALKIEAARKWLQGSFTLALRRDRDLDEPEFEPLSITSPQFDEIGRHP